MASLRTRFGAALTIVFGVAVVGSLLFANLAAGRPDATPITYVCIQNTTGKLAYRTSGCTSNETQVAVDNPSQTFAACYLLSNGLTREKGTAPCSTAPRKKEGLIPSIPSLSSDLFFCVNASDGTMFFKGTTGEPVCGTGQFAVVIKRANNPPDAVDDTANANEDGPAVTIDVLANDTDPDPGQTAQLQVSAVDTSTFGTKGAVTNNTTDVTYNPNGQFESLDDTETEVDKFKYTVKDPLNATDTSTVTVTVAGANDAPVAVNDAASVNEGGTVIGNVLSNDTDVDLEPLTAVLDTGPAHASSFMLTADGSFIYTHDGGETTSDSFAYHANDGTVDSNIATVTITVNPANDPPVANIDSVTVNEGGTLVVPTPGVLGNDTDAENDTLTAVLVLGPSHASTFTLNADGSYLYTHDGSETTSDSFIYKANDGSADSNFAIVTITIVPVDDPPTVKASKAPSPARPTARRT